jgi:hypothetical protein
MVAIRAIYDGESFKPLPSEFLPKVNGEVEVVLFLEEPVANGAKRIEPEDEIPIPRPAREWEAARRMRAARDAMEPLDCDIKDLIEEGRER